MFGAVRQKVLNARLRKSVLISQAIVTSQEAWPEQLGDFKEHWWQQLRVDAWSSVETRGEGLTQDHGS